MKYLVLLALILSACSEKNRDLGGCNDSYIETMSKPTLLQSSFAQVKCLNAPDYHDESTYRVIFSVYIQSIAPGSLLTAMGQIELTNDMPKPMMVASYIVLTDSPHNINGIKIGYRNAFNITPWMHHGVISNYGTITVPEQMDGVYVNFVAYSASGEKFLTGEFVTVKQNTPDNRFGGLDVIIYE